MQLARYRQFITALGSELTKKNLCESVDCYRRQDGRWYRAATSELVPETLVSDLDHTLSIADDSWRHPSATTAYFSLRKYEAVVAAGFVTAPNKGTRTRVEDIITVVEERARNAFDASHDRLTGLLNREHFVALAVSSYQGHCPTDVDFSATSEGGVPALSAMIAIDIDHFKQVNDSYGHLYGDLVLQALAERLRTHAIDAAPSDTETLVARPSGEEFLVWIAGQLTYESIADFAESLRARVASTPLPSSHEETFSWVASREVTLPPIQERAVTISVGYAVAAFDEQQGAQAIRQLQTRADKALYRAKAGGRNTVRRFSEILHTCGTVIQHWEATDIVAIDIGTDVGARIGQEFLIYYPPFQGGGSYHRDDGRTTRVLGTFPRVPSGRIVIFDAQSEISFCQIEEQEWSGELPGGAALEAIPLGSITHLLGGGKLGQIKNLDLGTPNEIAAFCQDHANNARLFAVTFILVDEATLAEERGSYHVNELLAALFENLHEHFGSPMKRIAQTQTAELSVAGIGLSWGDLEVATHSVRDAVASEFGHATIKAGYFHPQKSKAAKEHDSSSFIPSEALKYARIAAGYAATHDVNVVPFSAGVATAIVVDGRRKLLYAQALADFRDLRQLGVDSASFLNASALAAIELSPPDRELAIRLITETTTKWSEIPLQWYNAAFIYFQGRLLDEAFAAFVRAFELDPSLEPQAPYLRPLAFASLHAYKENLPDAPSRDELVALLTAALHDEKVRRHRVSLEQALTEL